jgi:cation diffusion facilitator family transporter
MHTETPLHSCHESLSAPHSDRHEARTRWVVALTAGMMVLELVVGTLTRSLALTADGWHMATHAGALGVAALAYWFARTRARTAGFTFGTGKVYALAGYTNAVVLLLVALFMIVEAAQRLLHPVAVRFAEALPVAVVGLVVNLVSAWLLDAREHHDDQADDPLHDHGHAHHHDHNLRGAYLHVLADAFTSVLAIMALLGARFLGLGFLDPVVAIVGSLLISHWGLGLVRASTRQLLDAVPDAQLVHAIRRGVEALDDARVTDLHVWEIGPGRRGCILSVLTSTPRTVDAYRAAVLTVARVEHLTIQVERCPHADAA